MTRPRLTCKQALEARYQLIAQHPLPEHRWDWFEYGLAHYEAQALYDALRAKGYNVEVEVIEDY